jgi:hypothetical protein
VTCQDGGSSPLNTGVSQGGGGDNVKTIIMIKMTVVDDTGDGDR